MGDDSEYALDMPGDMTIYEAAEIKDVFLQAINEHKTINVNLAKVSEIDSAGLQLMVSFKKDALDENKTVTYHSHSQAVVSLLDLFGMTSYFGDPVVIGK